MTIPPLWHMIFVRSPVEPSLSFWQVLSASPIAYRSRFTESTRRVLDTKCKSLPACQDLADAATLHKYDECFDVPTWIHQISRLSCGPEKAAAHG